jgi:putative ABC transport system substrate-binding protein
MTSRREFFRLLGGGAAWSVAARAQPEMPVIGFLHSGSARTFGHAVTAFRRGLRETGSVDGQNVAIEYRWADGQYDRLPALAADLIRNHVVAIFAGGPPAALAAKAASSTVPIVFTSSDPVKAGLVASFDRPGGNATGVSFFTVALGAKRLELLRELVPRAGTIGMLINPNFPDAGAEVADVRAAARAGGLELQILHAINDGELEAAFADMGKQRIDALVVAADVFLDSRRDQLAVLAARHAIPAIYYWREFVTAGGLMSYGTSITEGYRQAGNYVARIVKGAQPSDLPVVQPTKFELVINLQAAKALGLTVPLTLQVAADEVIE